MASLIRGTLMAVRKFLIDNPKECSIPALSAGM
jgi:hypothetical protein